MCHGALSRGSSPLCVAVHIVCLLLLTGCRASEVPLVRPATIVVGDETAVTLSNPGTYAHPEVLVETDWVKENLGTSGIKLIEIDVDTKAYESGHIPGAVGFNWKTQLQAQVARDILSKEAFEKLLGNAGISPEDTVILYGDNNNWFAAYSFWVFKIYGHKDVRLMNGGRDKWLNEPDKKLTTDPPKVMPATYKASVANLDLRASVRQVMEASTGGHQNLVDVRSPAEFTGKVIAPPGMNETAQRGGHIPGALSIPWSMTIDDDGTFKSVDQLRSLYIKEKGLDPNKDTIAYCRIGERSSHTWFVLKYLVGFRRVKNYDGGWTEYGNLIAVPIEK